MEFPIKISSRLDNIEDLSQSDIYLVPCIADMKSNSFKPLLNYNCQKITQSVNNDWSPSEDSVLFSIVSSRGPRAWTTCAKELNSLCHQGTSVRQGKSCRNRWLNYLNPGIKTGGWTKEEDDMILKARDRYRSRWNEIMRALENRTESSVKERYKELKRKEKLKIEMKLNKID